MRRGVNGVEFWIGGGFLISGESLTHVHVGGELSMRRGVNGGEFWIGGGVLIAHSPKSGIENLEKTLGRLPAGQNHL